MYNDFQLKHCSYRFLAILSKYLRKITWHLHFCFSGNVLRKLYLITWEEFLYILNYPPFSFVHFKVRVCCHDFLWKENIQLSKNSRLFSMKIHCTLTIVSASEFKISLNFNKSYFYVKRQFNVEVYENESQHSWVNLKWNSGINGSPDSTYKRDKNHTNMNTAI